MGTSTYPAVATSEIIYSAGEAVQGECVEFHLLYQGNQLTSDGRPNIKHAIRKEFHPQLKQLWKSNSQLSTLARGRGLYADRTIPLPDSATPEEAEASFFEWMGRLYARGNHHFVPLVEQSLCVKVSLDILFLRRDQHPLIKAGGDIDNRLKTLFDAFRVPDDTSGLGGVPDKGEDPFFVLLQDDSLISEVKVSTGSLLMLPQQKAVDAKDAFLVINVKLKTTERNGLNWAFE
jgi:hypothetical protein